MKKLIIFISLFANFVFANEQQTFNCHERLIYLMTFKVHQTTYTLNPFEHIKNVMNDVQFEVPVDEVYYNGGTSNVSGDFKLGSFVFNGDFSKLNVSVVGKRTVNTGTIICTPLTQSVETKETPKESPKKKLTDEQQKQLDKYWTCRKNSGVGDCIRNGWGNNKEKCMKKMEEKCGEYPEFK